MRRGDDGAVQLDCGRLGGVSERLVVTLEKDGRVTGRSALPAQTADDAPLEARVLEARNTIFSQELWYELGREARNLAAYNVKPDGSRLTYDLDPSSKTKLAVELVPLASQPSVDDSLPDDSMAEIAALALHILLTSAHRQAEFLRTRPVPPHFFRARGQQQPHSIIRPMIGLSMHYRHLNDATAYVGRIVQSLRRAGLPASFTLVTPRLSAQEPSPVLSASSFPQNVVRSIIPPVDFNIRLTLIPGAAMDVRGRTFLMPVTATYYQIVTPASSLVARICAPYREGYPTPEALYDYLGTATARVLAEHFRSLLASSLPATRWVKSIKGDSIRDADKEEFEMRFDLTREAKLLVTGTSQVEGKTLRREWEWTPDAATEPASLQDIVQREAKRAFPE